MRKLLSSYGFLLLFLFTACATKPVEETRFVSVLTFNVENLFDTDHDLGKQDYTYLPLSTKKTILRQSVERYCQTVKNPQWKKECREVDWSEAKLNEKLVRISRIIQESTSGCPDVVLLQEIENEKVLRRLNSMLGCGYQTVLLSDDRDDRGIDVAILAKFPAKSYSSQPITFTYMSAEQRKDTRPILEAELSVNGFPLRVMSVHLPAPMHPAHFRKEGVAQVEKIYFKDPIATIAGGDWNTPEKEGLAEKTFESLRKSFYISDDIVRASSVDQGTTFYKKEKTWSFLDKLALSRNSFDQVECKVINFLPGQRDRVSGEPLSFPILGKLQEGVSDHFPVLCRASY